MDEVDLGWRRSRAGIRSVAVVCSLLGGLSVYSLFDSFRVSGNESQGDRQLIATLDLRIANPAAAMERGEKQAREDVEAGLLKLQIFDTARPPTPADIARAQRLKKRYGIVLNNRGEATPQAWAYAQGYNRVAEVEIERRHGKDVLERLKHGEDSVFPRDPTLLN